MLTWIYFASLLTVLEPMAAVTRFQRVSGAGFQRVKYFGDCFHECMAKTMEGCIGVTVDLETQNCELRTQPPDNDALAYFKRIPDGTCSAGTGEIYIFDASQDIRLDWRIHLYDDDFTNSLLIDGIRDECVNLPDLWRDYVTSVYIPVGTCFRIFDQMGCTGSFADVRSGSDCSRNLRSCTLDMYKKARSLLSCPV